MEMLPKVKLVSLLVRSDPIDEWFRRFSSYQVMLRVLARMKRFVSSCRKMDTVFGILSSTELDEAQKTVVKSSQREYFPLLFCELSCKSPVSVKYLAQLSHFLDPDGVIRIDGRLRNAQIFYSQKYPILLAKSSHLSTIIVRHWLPTLIILGRVW